MTNTVKACNTVNLLDKTTYDQQTPSDTELWAVDEESDSDYKSMVVGWGMPSDTYEDLTLGTSGSTYTAPANGYFAVSFMSGSSHYCFLTNTSNGIGTSFQFSGGSTLAHNLFVPVKKGQIVSLQYVATINYFRFIYAEGEV